MTQQDTGGRSLSIPGLKSAARSAFMEIELNALKGVTRTEAQDEFWEQISILEQIVTEASQRQAQEVEGEQS